MRSIFNCFLIIGLWLLSGCVFSDNSEKKVTYERFDLFHLKGESVFKRTGTKKEYVEVIYKDSFPVSIKFILPKRKVTLLFKDSFTVNQKQPVYVYITSNLHGGNPGRQRIYTSHYVEYENVIYISLTDTILCKTFDKPTLNDYTYAINAYSMEGIGVIKEMQGNRKSSLDNKLTQEQVYFTWIDLVKKGFPDDEYPDKLIKQLPKP